MNTAAWRSGPALAALILLGLAATAGLRPLMLPDEGRYVGVAWEMLRSGDWATPTLDGLPFFHKPPLFYWITATALAVLGPNALAGRAASLLGATAAALAVAWLARRWSAPDESPPPVLAVLLTMPIFFIGAQFANLDMLVAGCISVAIAAFAHVVLLAPERASRAPLLVGYLALALGVLAKGLIGAVLPAGVVLAWLLVTRRPRLLLHLLWWPGVLLFAALALPWFAAMQHRHPGFYDYFVVEQHVHRFAGGGFNNAQPVWFYPAVLLALGLPWTLWRLPALWRGTERASPLRSLMLSWCAVVLLFFSLPQSKLVGYVLPAVPPLAWLLAAGAARPSPRALRMLAAVALVIGLAAVGALAWTGHRGAQPIARAWRARMPADAPLIFVGTYLYGLPVEAGVTTPSTVIDDWNDPEVGRRDNWRKELADAGRFDPGLARQRLRQRTDLPALLCAQAISGLVAPLAEARTLPLPAGAAPLATAADAGLWRFDRDAAIKAGTLRCPGMPNGG